MNEQERNRKREDRGERERKTDRGRVHNDEKERRGTDRVEKDTRSVIVGKFFQWATFSLYYFLKISLDRTNCRERSTSSLITD